MEEEASSCLSREPSSELWLLLVGVVNPPNNPVGCEEPGFTALEPNRLLVVEEGVDTTAAEVDVVLTLVTSVEEFEVEASPPFNWLKPNADPKTGIWAFPAMLGLAPKIP